MNRLVLGLALPLAAACTHARTVANPDAPIAQDHSSFRGAPANDEKQEKHVSSDAPPAGGSVAKPASPRREGRAAPNGAGATSHVPLARTAEGLLKPGGAKEIQKALHDKGYLATAPSGDIDPATNEALKRFQTAQGLAPTGIPDRGTVEKLGLDQTRIFQGNGSDVKAADRSRLGQ